ncbi:DUF433 domain-containing protein [Brasilonema sp. CT11]|nr:DUF433 domain-containing protein [Brasilonema sp. CT11]
MTQHTSKAEVEKFIFFYYSRTLFANTFFCPKSNFKQGATAEEIVYRYPSLNLAGVYATIAFYLNHQQEVEIYLQQRQQQTQEVRRMNQQRFDPQGLHDRLLARKAEQ